jgi:dCMP deaminase
MGISCDGAELYVTHYPCINCSKIIVGSGIYKIYYLNDNHNDESKPLLDYSGIKIESVKFI